MNQQNNSQPKPASVSGLALIEKAQELRWTLQLALAVLFSDLILVWHTGHGLTQWSTSSDQLLANSGFLIIGVLVFGVLMSAVMPLTGEIFRQLIWQLIINIPWPHWMRTIRDYQRPPGNVYPSELRSYALKKGDKFLLDIYAAHEQKETMQTKANLEMGQLVFSILVLSTLNYKPNLIGLNGITALQGLVTLFGASGELMLVLGFMLAITVLNWTWFSMAKTDWIYYPPLYDEIIEERQNRNHKK